MEYKVKSGHSEKTVKVFDNLEAAINWCGKNMAAAKHGHYVIHIENGCLVKDYDTRCKALDNAKRKYVEKQAKNTMRRKEAKA